MNPLIPIVFSADPAARVWKNDDRLFLDINLFTIDTRSTKYNKL